MNPRTRDASKPQLPCTGPQCKGAMRPASMFRINKNYGTRESWCSDCSRQAKRESWARRHMRQEAPIKRALKNLERRSRRAIHEIVKEFTDE